MKYKICKKCSGTYSEYFFYKNITTNFGSHGFQSRETICKGCQISARTNSKRSNRSREKARRTLRHHAEKYIKLGHAASRENFAKKFGWNLDQMAHDINHAYSNGCSYCHEPYSKMGNGLSDLTLDIRYPDLLPYYETNTCWACATCNQLKQRTPPDLWGQILQDWKVWQERQNQLGKDQGFGTLFEGLGVNFSATKEPLIARIINV